MHAGPSGWALALGRSRGPRLLSPSHGDVAATSGRHGVKTAGGAGFEAQHAGGGEGGNGAAAAAVAADAAGSPTAAAGSAAAGPYGSERGTADSTLGSTSPGSVAGESGCQDAGDGGGPPWIAEASLQVTLQALSHGVQSRVRQMSSGKLRLRWCLLLQQQLSRHLPKQQNKYTRLNNDCL